MGRMVKQDWGHLTHFSMEEKDQQGRFAFPRPYVMDVGLMFHLEAMRKAVGQPFIIHESTGGIHDSDLHGLGMAVDGHFIGLSAIEQYLYAEQWNWPGLGFYPHWNDPGIHIDTRALGPDEKGARWWKDTHGGYQAITPGVILQP